MFKLSLGVTFIRHSEQIMHTNRLCRSMRFFVIPSDSRYSEGVLSFRAERGIRPSVSPGATKTVLRVILKLSQSFINIDGYFTVGNGKKYASKKKRQLMWSP